MSTEVSVHVNDWVSAHDDGSKSVLYRISVDARVDGKPFWTVSTETVSRKQTEQFIKEQIRHFYWDNQEIEMPTTYTLFNTKTVVTHLETPLQDD